MSSNPLLSGVHSFKRRKPQDNTSEPSLREIFFSPTMIIDFIAGCLGGIAGVLIGHPLDTIKVHLQLQDPKNPRYHGLIHCSRTIYKEEGVFGLYRGMTSPLAGISVVNAVVFGIYGNVQRNTTDPDSLASHFMAGSVAGLFQSVVSAPMELAKTRLQIQHEHPDVPKHKCPYDCLKHIVKTEGVRAGFKGLSLTAIRDVPGFAGYFVAYEYLMRLSNTPNAFYTMFCGGVAGIVSWLVCYPIDVVKTIIQVDGMSAAPIYKNSIDCTVRCYREGGFPFFFRGLGSTLIRAFPMNAACFLIVSTVWEFTHHRKLIFRLQSNPHMGVPSVDLDGIPNSNIQPNVALAREMSRRREIMLRNLRALSMCEDGLTDIDARCIAQELYPSNSADTNYYLLKEDILHNRSSKSMCEGNCSKFIRTKKK